MGRLKNLCTIQVVKVKVGLMKVIKHFWIMIHNNIRFQQKDFHGVTLSVRHNSMVSLYVRLGVVKKVIFIRVDINIFCPNRLVDDDCNTCLSNVDLERKR